VSSDPRVIEVYLGAEAEEETL
ncbi:MAG: hypothetical protein ACRC3F_02265, partial [Billgrantia desiderata]